MAFDTDATFKLSTPQPQLLQEHERLRRHIGQLEDQMRSLLVLQGVANTLSADMDLAPLLRRVAMAAVRLVTADVSVLYLVDASRHLLRAEAVETLQSAADSGAFSALDLLDPPRWDATERTEPLGGHPTVTIGEGIAGRVAATGEFVLLLSAQSDPRFPPEAYAREGHVLGVSPAALLAVPLLYQGAVTGVLEVAQARQHEGFDARSLDFMRTLAAQAALAVANAQLYHRLRDERDHIIQAQEDERKRLARELHDGPAQRLAQLAMALEHAEDVATREPDQLLPELRMMRELAVQTTRDVRNLLFDLRPLVLESAQGGLVAAIEQLAARMRLGAGPQVVLDCQYTTRLSHEAEVTIFTIVQESVNNVLKHAHARTCRIAIRETAAALHASVRDDGAGFDTHQLQDEYERRGSWGMLSMLERAALIEAKLTISSLPGKGTAVALDVPSKTRGAT